MTALIDKHLHAAPPVDLPVDARPSPALPARVSAASLAERLERWKAIEAAGGIDPWITAQLKAKNLLTTDEGDDEEEDEDEDEDESDEDEDSDDDGDGDDDDEDEAPRRPAAKKPAAKKVAPAPKAKSDREKREYKEKKQAEASERRVLKKLARQAYTAAHISHLGAGIFWRDDARRPDAFDHPQRETRAQELKVELNDAKQLAEALGLTIPALRWLSFHREVDTGTHYRSWQIPKRDGKSTRTISSPKKQLKTAQRWLLRNVLEKLPVHGSAHGFLSARSIVTNAQVHAGAEVVIKVDIKDFFPSITWKRVKGLLRKHGLPEGVATLLSLLSTEAPRDVVQFRGKTLYVAKGPRALPQGAPTSPALTNAICLRLDRRLSGLARSLGFKYTRYADDLTFSWHPEPVLPGTSPQPGTGALLRGIGQILEGEGFSLNQAKTRIMRDGTRQAVTGLIVNGAKGKATARVPRETLRQLRAAIHNRQAGKPGKGESLEQLRGMAAFVHMTDPARGQQLLEQINALAARDKA